VVACCCISFLLHAHFFIGSLFVLISSTIGFCNSLGFSKFVLFHFLSFCNDASISTPSNSSYDYEHLLSFHLFSLSYLVLIYYMFDVCRFFSVRLWKFFLLHLFCLLLVLVHHGICSITNVLASFIMAIICNYLCFTFPSHLAFPHLFPSFFLGLKKKLLFHVCKCSFVMILFHNFFLCSFFCVCNFQLHLHTM
jgi:hypothetical protein